MNSNKESSVKFKLLKKRLDDLLSETKKKIFKNKKIINKNKGIYKMKKKRSS
jgi:hypothetical protein